MSNHLLPSLLLAACLATTSLPTLWAQAPVPTTAAIAAAVLNQPAKDASSQLKLSTERVVVFKDGYALVIKAATATADPQGRVFTPDLPQDAVLGCFWAAGDQVKLLSMKSQYLDSQHTQKTDIPALTIRDLLRANVGSNKKITLTLADDTTNPWTGVAAPRPPHTVTGTLTEIMESDPADTTVTLPDGHGALLHATPTTPPSPFQDPAVAPTLTALAHDGQLTVTRETTPRGGDFVVLDGTETGRMVLPIASIRSLGGEAVLTHTSKNQEVFTRSKRLTFDLGPDLAAKPVALHLFYFTPGIRWIPTYRVSGELKDKADLALQAEVLNELEDIDHAALDLVVGVPNFRFKQVQSPLTLERAMRVVFANGDLNLNGQMLSNQFSNASHTAAAPTVAAAPPVQPPAGPAELVGNAEQDLFVYPIKDFSLAKGARASLPLWQNTVPLKHLYTYDLKIRRSRSTGGKLDDNSSPLHLTQNQIWHQLELTNDSPTPWTTGAALMLKGNLPLGQDILAYTSPNASTLLPVTVAVDLRATSDEEEIERHTNALQVDKLDYAQVKKKGTITITNYHKEKSTIRITASTGGKVDAASDEGKIKVNDFHPEDWDDTAYMRPNNHSDITWEFTLDPSQSKTLTYTLTSYVR